MNTSSMISCDYCRLNIATNTKLSNSSDGGGNYLNSDESKSEEFEFEQSNDEQN